MYTADHALKLTYSPVFQMKGNRHAPGFNREMGDTAFPWKTYDWARAQKRISSSLPTDSKWNPRPAWHNFDYLEDAKSAKSN